MRLEGSGALGGITTKGHDVAEALVLISGDEGFKLIAGGAHASEVGHDLKLVFVFEEAGVAEGALSGGAPRAVGDADEVWLEGFLELFGCFEDLLAALFIFRREKLDGDHRGSLSAREVIGDGTVFKHFRINV